MKNRSLIIGVAVGVAALTAAGILMSKRNRSASDAGNGEQQLSDTFKNKLNSLQRKAKKELKLASSDGADISNIAKERANQWVSKTGANL